MHCGARLFALLLLVLLSNAASASNERTKRYSTTAFEQQRTMGPSSSKSTTLMDALSGFVSGLTTLIASPLVAQTTTTTSDRIWSPHSEGHWFPPPGKELLHPATAQHYPQRNSHTEEEMDADNHCPARHYARLLECPRRYDGDDGRPLRFFQLGSSCYYVSGEK